MQRKVTSIVIIMLIMAVSMYAQQSTSKLMPDEVGGSLVGTAQDRTSTGAAQQGAGPGINLFAKYKLAPNFFLKAGTGFLTATDKYFSSDQLKTTLFPVAEVSIGYNIAPLNKLTPFLNAGLMGYYANYSFDHDKNPATPAQTHKGFDPAFTGGLGLNYQLNEKLALHSGVDIAYAFMADAGNKKKPLFWMGKAGVSYALGKGDKKPAGDIIEYPVDSNELAIDDLFRMSAGEETSQQQNTQSTPSTSKDEEDALAMLFGEAESSSEDTGTETTATTSSDTYSEPAKPSTTYTKPKTANELIARIEQLQSDIQQNRQEVRSLKQKVDENERMIAMVSSGVQGSYASMPASSAGRVSDNSFKSNYKQALQYFYNRNYNEAIRIMRSLLSSNPDHRLASNCQYWIGESLNAMGDYRTAMQAFNTVLSYSKSYKFDDALLMAGLCSLKLGDTTTARDKFQTLISQYPDSEYAPKAMRYLGRL